MGGAINIVSGNCHPVDASACRWLYPPWTAFVFAPFALLPVDGGILALQAAVSVAAAAAIAVMPRALVAVRPAGSLALAITLAFPPLVLATRTGHLSGRATPFVTGAIVLGLKPHLFLVLAPLALAVLVARGHRRAVLAAIAVLGAIAVITIASYPPPALDTVFAQATDRLTFGSATIWTAGRWPAPEAPVVASLALLASGVGCALVAVRRPLGPADAAFVAVTLGVSLLVAPYAQAYDHSLLPALLLSLAGAARLRGPARALTLTGVVGVAVLYPWLVFFANVLIEDQGPSGLLPLLALAILAVVSAISDRPGTATAPLRTR